MRPARTRSFIAVPPRAAPAAIIDAASAGIRLVVCITEHIPAKDEALVNARLVRDYPGIRLIGPNCPGIISPGKCNIGITSGDIARPGGPVGIVSRSGTLTYQALHELSQQSIGQTTCVGIGGDPVPGTTFVDVLAAFQEDPETLAVMMIGEIGGEGEERAADFIAAEMDKPVVAYIAGVTAPEGRKMGHAGAIVSGHSGTAKAKMEALSAAGVLSRGTRPKPATSWSGSSGHFEGCPVAESGDLLLEEIEAATAAVQRIAVHTPIYNCRVLSELTGSRVVLKAENLQRTGSFKIRGASAKLAALGDGAWPGVVVASAGNHAQAVAFAARSAGVPCEVFMPAEASISKADATIGYGASVHLEGESLDDCVLLAQARARETGLHFVHPFDDRAIVRAKEHSGSSWFKTWTTSPW